MNARSKAIADALRRTNPAAADRFARLSGKREAIEQAAQKASEERDRRGTLTE